MSIRVKDVHDPIREVLRAQLDRLGVPAIECSEVSAAVLDVVDDAVRAVTDEAYRAGAAAAAAAIRADDGFDVRHEQQYAARIAEQAAW